MIYLIELLPKAVKDLTKLPKAEAVSIVEQIRSLENGLVGDVKKLTNFTPEYRLRVGKYRVLFEIDGQQIIVYRIAHRKEAYTKR